MTVTVPAPRLDTGPLQPHAPELYRRAGCTGIDPFNDDPSAPFWGDKLLGAVVHAGRTVRDEGHRPGPCRGESVH